MFSFYIELILGKPSWVKAFVFVFVFVLILCTSAVQTGHGPEADLWSLGILIYELVEVGRLVGQISCTSTDGKQ